MFTAAELADLRSEQNAAMPDTCVISRPTLSQNDIGEETSSYATSSTVACRLAARTAASYDTERTIGDQWSAFHRWDLTVPYGTDIQTTDRVVIGSRTFEIDSVDAGASYATAIRALVTEIQ